MTRESRPPRVDPTNGPRVTYVHAPDWFGLDGLIGADMLWPESFGKSIRTLDDVLSVLTHPDVAEDGPALTADLRGDRTVGVDIARLARMRAGRRVVLIADQPPPPEFPVFGTRIVGPAELALRPEEIRSLLSDAGYVVTAEVALAIGQESAGWPSLVEACAAGMRRGEPYADPASAITAMRLAAKSAVLAKLPDTWTRASQDVAVRDGLAPEEVEDLDAESSAVIHEMLSAHLLVSGGSSNGSSLSLVPAIQAAVLAKLAAEPVELARLRTAAARDRNRLGILDAGLDAAHAAGDYELCAEILDRWTMKFAFTEHRAVAQRVTLAIPTKHLAERSSAALRAEFLGVLPVGTTPVRIPSSQSARRAASRSEEARRVLERTFQAMVGRRTHGRFADACDIARATSPLVDLGVRSVHSSVSGIASLWHLHAGLSHQLNSDFASARQHFQKGWQARNLDELGFAARDLASKFALLNAVDGSGQVSRRWLRTLDALPVGNQAADSWINYTVGVSQLTLAVDGLDSDTVEIWLDRFGEGSERDELWVFGLRACAEWELSGGRPGAARQILKDSARLPMTAGSDGIHFPLMRALSADAWLAEGQAHPASRLLDQIPESSPFRRVPDARLLTMTGQHEETLRQVTAYLALPDTSPRDRLQLHLIRAAAADALGDRATASAALAEVVRSVRGGGHLRMFATVQTELLDRYAEQVPELQKVLRTLENQNWGPIHPASADLVTLSARESVVLRQLAAGGTNQEIGEALHVSTNTVKTQLRGLYAKLGVSSREQALTQARTLGLLR